MNRNHVAAMLAVSWIAAPDQASSAVVDSGVDTTIRHYVFGFGSTATYQPSTLVIVVGEPSESGSSSTEPETRDISGSFDAEFSRYWWEYDLGDTDHSTALFEQYWLRLSNAKVRGGGDWAGLELFDSLLLSEGADYASFSGDSGPCMFPSGPDFYCTGFSSGAAPSASGGLFGGEMTLTGVIPLDTFGSSYYSYSLVAATVPIPAAVWLFGSWMTGLAIFSRRRTK